MPNRVKSLLKKTLLRNFEKKSDSAKDRLPETTNPPPPEIPNHPFTDLENIPPTTGGNLSRVTSTTTTRSTTLQPTHNPPGPRPSLKKSTYSSSFASFRTTLSNRNKPRCGYCCRILEGIPGYELPPEEEPLSQKPTIPRRWESRIPEIFNDELRLKKEEGKGEKIMLCGPGGRFCVKQFPSLDGPKKVMPECEDEKADGYREDRERGGR